MSVIDNSARKVSRRTLAKGAAWATPAVMMVGLAPTAAASDESVPSQFSSWGSVTGSVSCKSSCSTYKWNIDNTRNSRLSYHGVLFPQASVGQVYSNIINVYYLPFDSGSVTQGAGASGNPHWSKLAPSSAYPTLTGPGGATYYPWVTTLVDNSGNPASVTVLQGQVDSHHVFHLKPDYQFSVKSTCGSFSGQEWDSHEYSAYLDGAPLVCSTPVNHNYCGGSANYPSNGNTNTNWRNNGWVGPLTSSCSGGGNHPEAQALQAQALDSTATSSGAASPTTSPSSSSSDAPVIAGRIS